MTRISNPLPAGRLLHPALTALLFTATLGLLPATTAHATFPGANGKIVFVSDRDGNDEIYSMTAAGALQTRLTTNVAFDYAPVWSPDGTRIAFVSDRDGNDEIYVMNANGSGQTRLTSNAASDVDPTWSPDGTRIAFTSNRDGQVNGEVYVMNADGTAQINVSNNAAYDQEPAWSPDGSRIAFVSDRDGNLEIYVMSADGSGQTRLTTDPTTDAEPTWSPDSYRIAFRSARDGNPEIYVIGLGGTGQLRLTTNPAVDVSPVWSPEGTQIAFSSDRNGDDEIYLMNADGTGPVRLTTNVARESLPDWQRTAPAVFLRGFEGTSSLINCAPAVGQCYRPPTPSGAIGTTQFLEANNGSVAIYDKATGALVQRTAMPTFWSNVGLPDGALGDHRVLFDHFTSRWIISGYGPTLNTRNLAISDSDNALGTWKSVRITVLAAGTADAGTLSVDEKAVYIATNNFNPGFVGTSLLTIPKADLFNGFPTLANMTTFDTPFPLGTDRGFLIQVANNWQANPSNSATVIADSRDSFGLVSYRLNGVGAAGATQTTAGVIPGSAYSYVSVDRARQPDGTRLVPLIQGNITANAVQRDGLVFATSTVRSSLGDFAAVRWTVVDAATGALRSSGLIEQSGYDFYQGTIAINPFGEVVIAYNRSGTAVADGDGDGLADGNISLLARTYYVDAEALVQTGSELKLRVSGISDYHCGPRTPVNTSCTQRWGNWAAVTVDPSNPRRFYALGEYASQWGEVQGSLPFAIWNTYIAEIEPPSPVVFDIDTVADRIDDDTSDGICHTSANNCSLRAAIMQANRLTVAVTRIQVPSGVYVLARPPNGFNGDDSGDLNFTSPIVANQSIELIGAGKDSTIIDANQIDGVMTIHRFRRVTLRHLTLRNGDRRSTPTGGGILNIGRLSLSDCAIEGNQSSGGGGGIWSSEGSDPNATLDIVRCTLQSNTGTFGGAVYANGPVTIRDTTIHGNHGLYGGGGIYNDYTLYVVNSTISQNTTDGSGGGIFSDGQGAAITAALYNTSVINNDADRDADVLGGIAGGIYVRGGTRFIAVNTLIAANRLRLLNQPIYSDCNGVVEVYGWNLLGDSTGCTFVGNGALSWNFVSLSSIGPLQDNGGPTWTHALLPGSAAIDSTNDALGCVDSAGVLLNTDQRGAARVSGLRCDVGAYEYGATVAPELLFANSFE